MKTAHEHVEAIGATKGDDWGPAVGALAEAYAAILAELEALRPAVETAAKYVGEGCGDNSCIFERPRGMATNGGCRCVERRPGVRHALAKLYKATKAAVERLGDRRPGPDWQAESEGWRKAFLGWQQWGRAELARLGLQPEGGEWGDGPARERLSAALHRGGKRGGR